MTTDWIKATASGQGGSCVEMRRRGDAVEVSDSKDPDGPVLHITRAEFAAWLDAAKHAEFDHFLTN